MGNAEFRVSNSKFSNGLPAINPRIYVTPSFQPEIGFFAWGPVLDANFSVPRDSWFRGTWSEKDWHFLPKTPEELIKESRFNPDLKYMAGVTTQEAANMICKLFCMLRAISAQFVLHNNVSFQIIILVWRLISK